jgi:hypothetical protein
MQDATLGGKIATLTLTFELKQQKYVSLELRSCAKKSILSPESAE